MKVTLNLLNSLTYNELLFFVLYYLNTELIPIKMRDSHMALFLPVMVNKNKILKKGGTQADISHDLNGKKTTTIL